MCVYIYVYICVCMCTTILYLYFINAVLLLSHFSRVRPSVTPLTAAFQAPLSMGFSRQEYWSGVPLPSLNAMLIRDK